MLVSTFSREIAALSERGVDSVLVLHMLRYLDPSDPLSHDVDALERKAITSLETVSICTV